MRYARRPSKISPTRRRLPHTSTVKTFFILLVSLFAGVFVLLDNVQQFTGERRQVAHVHRLGQIGVELRIDIDRAFIVQRHQRAAVARILNPVIHVVRRIDHLASVRTCALYLLTRQVVFLVRHVGHVRIGHWIKPVLVLYSGHDSR